MRRTTIPTAVLLIVLLVALLAGGYALWPIVLDDPDPVPGPHEAAQLEAEGTERGPQLETSGVARDAPSRTPPVDEVPARRRNVRVLIEASPSLPKTVTVRLLGPEWTPVATAQVTPGREHIFSGFPWDGYLVHASADGLVAYAGAAWDGITLLKLVATRRVTGTVLAHEKAPLEGAGIYAFAEGAGWMYVPHVPADAGRLAKTDAKGRFACEVPVTDREFVLQVYHPLVGWKMAWVEDGDADTTLVVNFELVDPILRRFRVEAADGSEVIPTIRAEELVEGAALPQPASATFEMLWSRVNDLPLFFDAPGFATVEVPAVEEPIGLETIVMRPAKGWRVRVHDTAGRAVPSVGLTLVAAISSRHREIYWTRTDRRGFGWIPHFPEGARLHVWPVRMRPVRRPLDPEGGEVTVVLEDHDAPVLVLPAGLPTQGTFVVSQRDEQGLTLWKRWYQVRERETRLTELIRGPKHGQLRLSTMWNERIDIEFGDEERIEVPLPEGWEGLADVRIEIHGGGDLDGSRATIVGERKTRRSVRIVGREINTRLRRNRSYTLKLRSLRGVDPFRFEVGPDATRETFTWELGEEDGRVVRWMPKLVDATSGEPLGEGEVSVFAVDELDNDRLVAFANVRGGRVEMPFAPRPRMKVIVRTAGHARHVVGPMTGEALVALKEIRVPRALPRVFTWDPRVAPKVAVFLVEIRKRDRPPVSNLEPYGSGREGRMEVVTDGGATFAVWGLGDDVASRPCRVEPGDERIALDLQPTATLRVHMPERATKGADAAVWIEYPEAQVGYSPLGLWRLLPYPTPAARCLRAYDPATRTAVLKGLPAGRAQLRVRIGEREVSSFALDLRSGRTTEVKVD